MVVIPSSDFDAFQGDRQFLLSEFMKESDAERVSLIKRKIKYCNNNYMLLGIFVS